ncbi:MAG TPA: 4-hydroxy-3-methylbut-2-enyl diphosphate reductase [Clostridiales bacterium]|nr:4-hydroxy-3-methylbut-2-enyl diphosphate reductase [Clostridiales bacterium]
MKIRVVTDERSGVCGGVSRAIKMIEKEICGRNSRDIYVNGELLHNRLEMERLVDCGLKVEEDVEKIRSGILFIRTHGVSKDVKRLAVENKNKVIDATCPKVSNSQRIIEDHFSSGYQIVIVGKEKHPEVKGLLGYCNFEGICILKNKDIHLIDMNKKTLLIAQTTVASERFEYFASVLKTRISDLEIANTICPFVEKRELELVQFAQDHNIVIFIGGKNSSNTKLMFDKFSAYNKRSYLIENKNEIDFSWFRDNDLAGISGSASTPTWQIEEVKKVIEDHFSQ